MRAWVYWALTVAVALTTGVYVFFYLDGLQDTVPVVVAATDIGPYTDIEAKDLVLAQVNRNDRHPLAYARLGEVVGSRTVEPLYTGEQVLASRLSGGREAGLTPALEGADRLLFLPVSTEEAVGGLLRRGDRVDVYHFTDRVAGRDEARLLLTGLRVAQTVKQAGSRQGSGDLLGVVLEVRAEEAALLVFAIETGPVRLALVDDESPIQVPPVDAGSVMLKDQYGSAEPEVEGLR